MHQYSAVKSVFNDLSPDIALLVQMLRFRRAEGSKTQKIFCKKYLEPIFGKPDVDGNYYLKVGESNKAFMAHHDTVHIIEGEQKIIVTPDNKVVLPENSKSNCLGADCTTGIWLILHMIKHHVPGHYVIHAGEECGGVGSRAIVSQPPPWLLEVTHAISFDRKGYNSIITHQMGCRTCSDEFAAELSMAFSAASGGKVDFKIDTTGTFTDSEVYSDTISECTNISVGYMYQHSASEMQCLTHAEKMANILVTTKWDSIKSYRDPQVYEYLSRWGPSYKTFGGQSSAASDKVSKKLNNGPYDDIVYPYDTLHEICYMFSDKVAELLISWGIDRKDLIEMMQLKERDF